MRCLNVKISYNIERKMSQHIASVRNNEFDSMFENIVKIALVENTA